MKKTELVNQIVNEYLKWERWCEINGFSKDDDDHYAVWLKSLSEEVVGEMQNELEALCEDNEEMKSAIKEYFE